MRLALVHLWKEWRAQRALLCAYTGLIFSCLCLGLWLAPAHFWHEGGFDSWRSAGFGLHALSWFVAAGVIGIVGFVAPGLVRGEYGQKDDQFVRRLPGALRPSFSGKLLFLVLATMLLPLLGLLVGEVFVRALGGNWDDLVRWQPIANWWLPDEPMRWNVPEITVWCGVALCCVPWLWAVGTWMPGGRLALLGTVLFLLLLGVSVFAVLRQSPGLSGALSWQPWLWAAPPVGMVVAALSWLRGRRGGGPLRSARIGISATAALLSPFALWLGAAAWRYHHPDLQRLQDLTVVGVGPSGRYVLAAGNENGNFADVPLRIDLETGRATQLGGIYTGCSTELLRSLPSTLALFAEQRFWQLVGEDLQRQVLDLETGVLTPCGWDRERNEVSVAASLRDAIQKEQRAASRLLAPGGVVVTFGDGRFVFTMPDGGVENVASPLSDVVTYAPAGHGLRGFCRDGTSRYYDLCNRSVVDVPNLARIFFVGGLQLFRTAIDRGPWQLRRKDGEVHACAELDRCEVLGLIDDRRVLACRETRNGMGVPRLFAFSPETGEVRDIPLSREVSCDDVRFIAPMRRGGSLIERDPEGAIWLSFRGREASWARLDVERLSLEPLPCVDSKRGPTLLSWGVWPRVLVQRASAIERVDVHTGAREVLFPRR